MLALLCPLSCHKKRLPVMHFTRSTKKDVELSVKEKKEKKRESERERENDQTFFYLT